MPSIYLPQQAVHSLWIGRGLHFPFAPQLFFGLLCKEAFSHGVEQCIAQSAGGPSFRAGELVVNGDVFDVDHDLLSLWGKRKPAVIAQGGVVDAGVLTKQIANRHSAHRI